MSAEKIKPIRPAEVAEAKLSTMPDVVIETFNELLAQHAATGSECVIEQGTVVALLVKKGLNRSEIFKNGWLDVEEIYRKAGWIVEFDKPGYNETYEPYFVFRPKKKSTMR